MLGRSRCSIVHRGVGALARRGGAANVDVGGRHSVGERAATRSDPAADGREAIGGRCQRERVGGLGTGALSGDEFRMPPEGGRHDVGVTVVKAKAARPKRLNPPSNSG